MGNDVEFAAMVNFVEQHNIAPLVCRRYPFEQIDNAIKQMENTGMPCKTVVVF